jgi:uncharacterized protein YdeI (YjbR/CyaY-like superfamily)
MNTLVSTVHGNEKRWREEFSALRDLCLASGLHESLKWGKACYDLDGSNIVLIHGFKVYCAILFMKGALLRDRSGVLVQQTKNVQSQRQIRFTSIEQIHHQAALVGSYIEEAIALEKSGATVVRKTVAQFEMADEFRSRLEADPSIAKAFHALSPGRQKAYLLHFSGAKQSTTRAARVEKNVPRILKGMGLND